MIGFDAQYVDLAEQDRYLDRFPRLKPLIPYNSDNRRNIGYLMAAERGAESSSPSMTTTSSATTIGMMATPWSARNCNLKTVSCSNGWFNPCRLMDTGAARSRSSPRLSLHQAAPRRNEETYSITEGRVVLNGGLWLDDPDVDSLTRLTVPARGGSPERGAGHARAGNLGADQHPEHGLPSRHRAGVLLRAGRRSDQRHRRSSVTATSGRASSPGS